MTTRRFASSASSYRYVVVAGCTLALLVAINPAGIQTTAASTADMSGSPVADSRAAQAEQAVAEQAVNERQTTETLQAADAPRKDQARQLSERPLAVDAPQLAEAQGVAKPPQPAAMSEVAISSSEATTPAIEPAAPAFTGTVTSSAESRTPDKPAAFEVASADPSEILSTEQPVTAAATTQDHEPDTATRTSDAVEVFDECFVVNICVDRYLWALYQRAPKEDKMRVSEQRAVTIKRKGKMMTVTRTFSRLVDENFAWKDEAASNKSSMPMEDYVIGGMDPGFKLKLFHTLHAAEAAGLSPGITSAFRDDYRQSIATGLKAATDRSYHGGSYRGGYGHGLAADIISVKGATRAERSVATEALWKWVDSHGKEFGIGRPYLSYDPPHVGPTDGQEYVSRRGGDKVRQAYADMRKQLAARHAHGSDKRSRVASAKASRVHSARNAHARTT